MTNYRPLQVPFLLRSSYAEHFSYAEDTPESLQQFVIALWSMQPISKQQVTASHVILADGCIDLVVDYRSKTVVFSGMSKTLFDDKIDASEHFLGARMKPGAFAQLTGLPAAAAMDNMLPLQKVDPSFDINAFFALPFAQTKDALQQYLEQMIGGKQPNEFVTLFDRFCDAVPATTAELYQALHLSPRQCQRLFQQHFALTPQMVLSVLRFQRCLSMLTTNTATPSDIIDAAGYYDQPHFIKDFKRNIGLTPKEYLNTINMSHIYKTSSSEFGILIKNELGGKQPMQTNLTDRATQLIQQAATVHLAVVDNDGYPVVMAMSPTNVQGIDALCMTTTLDSNKAKHLQHNQKASVCCSTAQDNITLVGEVEICTDQTTKSKCWQNWFVEVYPGGETDPNYCVLKFKTKHYKLYVDGEVGQGELS